MDQVMDEPANAFAEKPQSIQASCLCQPCLSVLMMDGLEMDKIFAHHTTMESYLAACQMNCYICSPTINQLNMSIQEARQAEAQGSFEDPFLEEKYPNSTDVTFNRSELWQNEGRYVSSAFFMGLVLESSPEGVIRIQILLNPDYEGYVPAHMKVHKEVLMRIWSRASKFLGQGPVVVTAKDMCQLGLPTAPLPCNTGSVETWSVINHWLDECATQHQCLSGVSTNWYPTRLVERISEDVFRVVRSDSQLFRRGEGYITLSHRWGPNHFMSLSMNKLSAFENGLPIKSLRKTFQEALIVAHRMKIRYIWIDSLCIIQSGDDLKDWRQESKTMSEVYSNSLCNISADWGDDDHGLFFERHTFHEVPYKLNLKWKYDSVKLAQATSSSDVPVSPFEGSPCYIMHPTFWIEDLEQTPLNRRGWVMQERLLSPRVLHFTPEQVSWECGKMLTSEKWPKRVFNNPSIRNLSRRLDHFTHSKPRNARSIPFFGQHQGEFQEAWRLSDSWYELVAAYTQCLLTNQSDKLVAIAGVARRLSPMIKDQYVAGLWARSLPWALAWRTCGLGQTQRPPTGYYAPTFSWAASEGEVRVPNYREVAPSEMMTFLSASFIRYRGKLHCSAAEQQPTTSGDVTFKGDVFGPLLSPEVEVKARGILRSCRRAPPGDYVCPSTGIEHPTNKEPPNRKEATVVFDRNSDRTKTDSRIYYYAPVLLDEYIFGGPHYPRVVGLFLESVDASMGRFRRIGHIFQRFYSDDKPDMLLPLGNERDLPAWNYDEATGEHDFYIL